jgi:8-oxo-dGTP pyrophosphatase MutT (NUDIX family)
LSAAVLLALLRRGSDARIPFTLRSENLENHRGEISFPGGRCEPGEEPLHAALREAFEEIALDPARIDVVGCLDDAVSVSGYVVTPVVGLCDDPPKTCIARASEVREVFEVPIADLSDRNRCRSEWWDMSRLPPGAPVEDLRRAATDSREFDGSTGRYRMYFFEATPNRVIWGLTARILKGFLEHLCDDSHL